MAAGILSAPGTELGPCEDNCHHTDCASTRATAEELCRHCHEPIGYEVRFYRLSRGSEVGRDFAHARCEEEAR